MTIELSGVTDFIIHALALVATFWIGYWRGWKDKKEKVKQ